MSDATIQLVGLNGNLLDLVFHDHDDEDWLSTSVSVRAGHFAGSYRAMFHREDVVALQQGFKRLDERFESGFEFVPTEPWLTMAISGDRLGHLTARCIARDNVGEEIPRTLQFTVVFDQSYLPELIKQVNYVLSRFPEQTS